MTDHKKLIAEARRNEHWERDAATGRLLEKLADTLEAVTMEAEWAVGYLGDEEPRPTTEGKARDLVRRWPEDTELLTRQVTPWKRVEVEG